MRYWLHTSEGAAPQVTIQYNTILVFRVNPSPGTSQQANSPLMGYNTMS
jgi:hypothetical protein